MISGEEKRYDIETLSIGKELYKKDFLWKNHTENVHQKVVPNPFLIMVNKPKQLLHTRNSPENKIF